MHVSILAIEFGRSVQMKVKHLARIHHVLWIKMKILNPKQMIPNQLFNPPGNFLLFEKDFQPMTKKLLLMLLFVCAFATNSWAQTAAQRPILQVDDFIASVRANTTARSANSQAARISSLVRDAQPTAYYQSGTLKLPEEGQPVRLYTNIASLPAIQNGVSGLAPDVVEIVRLKVANASQLNGGIDLSAFSGFPNLRFIYIASDVEVTPEMINSALVNDNPNYQIFYENLKYN